MGVRSAEDPGATWHSPPEEVIGLAVAYLVGVAVLTRVVRGWERMELKWLKSVYNMFMAVLSLWMFYDATWKLCRNWAAHGWDISLLWRDDELVLRDGMESIYYWFYMSKYIEFVDTVFLILAQKQSHSVGWYLQLYHHSTTASVAWVAWFKPMPQSFVGVVTNTFVHIFMYAYFSLTSHIKSLRKYGHLITMLQLVQFYLCFGLSVIFVPVILYAGSRVNKFGLFWITSIYVSYLLFFLAFDRERKSRVAKADKGASATDKKTLAEKKAE